MKRANNSGSIYKDRRRNGYISAISIGYDEKTGRQIRRTRHSRTLSEATRALEELKATYGIQSKKDINKSTLGDYIKRFISTVKKPQIKPQTYYNYKSLVKALDKLNISKCKLTDITSMELINSIESIKASSTKRKIANIIKSALQTATNDGIIKNNIAANIKVSRKPTREKRTITTQDYKIVRASIPMSDNTTKLLLDTLWFTGARIGEVLALKWASINTTNNTVKFSENLTYYGGTSHISTLKTKASNRQLKIPTQLLIELQKHKKKQAAIILSSTDYNNKGLIFADESGNALKIYKIRYKLQKALDTLQERHTIHDIRHTHATIMLQKGYNIKEIQARLGHAKVTTTLDIYTHATNNADQTELFNALLTV